MPREKDDNVYIWDMLDAGEAVVTFARGRSFDDYLNDRMLRSAVERQIEIVGEAARRVSDAFKSAHPAIPWRLITAQRHVLAHDYGDIEHDKIWRVVTIHVPQLIEQLTPLLPPPPPAAP